jgi:CBS domain-containing protein
MSIAVKERAVTFMGSTPNVRRHGIGDNRANARRIRCLAASRGRSIGGIIGQPDCWKSCQTNRGEASSLLCASRLLTLVVTPKLQESIMNVEDVMHRSVHTCRPEDSLSIAAGLMWDRDVGCIPVVDDGDKPTGMITDRDICMSAFLTGKPLAEQQVSQAMAKEVHVARVGQSIQSATELMGARQIRRLPIVDRAGKLAGIISLNDLALAAGSERSKAVKPDELTATLASICQPRPDETARA